MYFKDEDLPNQVASVKENLSLNGKSSVGPSRPQVRKTLTTALKRFLVGRFVPKPPNDHTPLNLARIQLLSSIASHLA